MIYFSKDFKLEVSSNDQLIIDDAFKSVTDEYKSGRIGYYNLPKESLSIVDEVKNLEKTNPLLSSGMIKDVVIIGIGGSSLGIKAINSLLCSQGKSKRDIHFFENTDPVDISRTMKKLKKESSIFIVISKSGSTIETTSILKTLISHFGMNLEGEDRDRVFAITDHGSSLSQFADHYGLKAFYIPLNVGGRFSVLSAVGIAPLTLAGYDTSSLLKGAGEFLDSFFANKEAHLLEKALFLYNNSKKYTTNIIFSYANDLENLSKWYVQLWGESLGKIDINKNSVGLTPLALIGSVDQHSFLQLLIEGPKDKTVTFINVKDFENNLKVADITLPHIEKTDFANGYSFNELINMQCDATRESLIQSNVPTDGITIATVNEFNIGMIMIYFEILTSVVGSMLKVNTYDQPGVELGKVILYKKFEK
jgi:glucose-6-phosphate isomerase